MNPRQDRWAAVATGAVVVAVMAATWLMCDNVLAWQQTFRLEDLAIARGQGDDFEAYRPDGFGLGTAWAAVGVAVAAVVLAAVAGVLARRWRPLPATVIAACVLVAVAAGAVLPVGPFVLLVGAIPITVALRSLSGAPAVPHDVGVANSITSGR